MQKNKKGTMEVGKMEKIGWCFLCIIYEGLKGALLASAQLLCRTVPWPCSGIRWLIPIWEKINFMLDRKGDWFSEIWDVSRAKYDFPGLPVFPWLGLSVVGRRCEEHGGRSPMQLMWWGRTDEFLSGLLLLF